MQGAVRGLKWRHAGQTRWQWVLSGGDGGTKRLPRPFRSEGAARQHARAMLAQDPRLEVRIVPLDPAKAAIEPPALFRH